MRSSKPDPHTVFRLLKTGKFIEVETSTATTAVCHYVDHLGRRLTPIAKNVITLSLEFLESYATAWRLDNQG